MVRVPVWKLLPSAIVVALVSRGLRLAKDDSHAMESGVGPAMDEAARARSTAGVSVESIAKLMRESYVHQSSIFIVFMPYTEACFHRQIPHRHGQGDHLESSAS